MYDLVEDYKLNLSKYLISNNNKSTIITKTFLTDEKLERTANKFIPLGYQRYYGGYDNRYMHWRLEFKHKHKLTYDFKRTINIFDTETTNDVISLDNIINGKIYPDIKNTICYNNKENVYIYKEHRTPYVFIMMFYNQDGNSDYGNLLYFINRNWSYLPHIKEHWTYPNIAPGGSRRGIIQPGTYTLTPDLIWDDNPKYDGKNSYIDVNIRDLCREFYNAQVSLKDFNKKYLLTFYKEPY